MAKLTADQSKRQIERRKAQELKLKSKMEAQEKKAIFGENWREIEQNRIQKELELELGSDKTPKIYDFKDRYDFFDPIIFYKDEKNEALNMDYEKYLEAETKFANTLIEIDKELAELNKESDGATVLDEDNKSNILLDDGTSEIDKELPAPKEGEENSAKKLSASSYAKSKINQILSTYFNRFVPLYNKHVCTCCGKPKGINDFYVNYNLTCADRVDPRGSLHMWVCKECCQKLFNYYYVVLAKKNLELAMQYFCASLNLYWDVDLFYISRKKYEDEDRKNTLIGTYISTINSKAVGMTFMDSPFIADEQYASTNRMVISNKDDAPYDWSKEDAKNKKEIIHLIGYDPFVYEEDDEERRILYADLISIMDEDVKQDYVKIQSAVTIVKSFTKVRKLDQRAHEMEKEDAPLNDQKALADLKAKELKAISDFSRDSGFSERFKSRQSQGDTSFTGILKNMNEKKYESEIINAYDIKTSSTIQKSADASFAAIFNQLNLSDAEYAKIAADQLAELVKLRRSKEELEEELRKTKYQLSELNLKEKARKAGILVEEDE